MRLELYGSTQHSEEGEPSSGFPQQGLAFSCTCDAAPDNKSPQPPAQLQDLSLLLTLLSESLQQKALTGALWSIHTQGTAAISHIEQNKNEYN